MSEGSRVKARGLIEPMSGEGYLRKLSGTAVYPSQCPMKDLGRFFIPKKLLLNARRFKEMEEKNGKHKSRTEDQ